MQSLDSFNRSSKFSLAGLDREFVPMFMREKYNRQLRVRRSIAIWFFAFACFFWFYKLVRLVIEHPTT